jgi:hypothetical protein
MVDAQPGASSAPATEPITASDALASLSETERATWQETGALPDRIQSPSAASTAAEPVEQVASTDALPETVSETVKEPEKAEKPKGAKARSAEIDADITELQQKLRLRAQLREELARTDKPDAKPADSSPAPVLAVDPTDPEPDPAKYEAGEYDAKYLRDIAKWEGRRVIHAERLAERQARDAAFVQESQTRLLDEGRKAHADFDAVLTAAEADGVQFSVAMTDAMFRESKGSELAYVLTTDRALYARIAALPLPMQEREIGRLLARFDTPAAPVTAPLKTLTDNPNPPETLGRRPATAPDAVERAVKERDAGAYIREANAREMAAKR